MSLLSVDQLLLTTSEDLSKNIRTHAGECKDLISVMISRLNLLDYWTEVLLKETTTVVILKEVSYDLLSSIYISTNGMYRNAYISLRSAIELGVSFFYFTDHNYDFLDWKRNKFDMTWTRLNDYDKGVLSKRYLNLFNEQFNSEEFIDTVKEVYRECSEYVHGKYEYMHSLKSAKIIFDKETFMSWGSMFIKVIDIILILLSVRFKDRLKLIEQDYIESMNDIFIGLGFKELIIENEY
jgi:hypothetical protein